MKTQENNIYILSRIVRNMLGEQVADQSKIAGVFNESETANQFCEQVLEVFSELDDKRTFRYEERDNEQSRVIFRYIQNQEEVFPNIEYECKEHKIITYNDRIMPN